MRAVVRSCRVQKVQGTARQRTLVVELPPDDPYTTMMLMDMVGSSVDIDVQSHWEPVEVPREWGGVR